MSTKAWNQVPLWLLDHRDQWIRFSCCLLSRILWRYQVTPITDAQIYAFVDSLSHDDFQKLSDLLYTGIDSRPGDLCQITASATAVLDSIITGKLTTQQNVTLHDRRAMDKLRTSANLDTLRLDIEISPQRESVRVVRRSRSK